MSEYRTPGERELEPPPPTNRNDWVGRNWQWMLAIVASIFCCSLFEMWFRSEISSWREERQRRQDFIPRSECPKVPTVFQIHADPANGGTKAP